MAQAYDLTPQYYYLGRQNSASVEEARRVVEASIPKAEAAAQRAIQLDPNLADGYVSMGLARRDRGKLLLAEDLFKQALALDPNNPDVLHWYSEVLGGVGRLREALAMRQQLHVLEPFVSIFNLNTAGVLFLNGQTDAAIAMLKDMPPGFFRADYLSRIYASMGRYSEAADVLLEIPSGTYPPGMVEAAARLLRTRLRRCQRRHREEQERKLDVRWRCLEPTPRQVLQVQVTVEDKGGARRPLPRR